MNLSNTPIITMLSSCLTALTLSYSAPAAFATGMENHNHHSQGANQHSQGVNQHSHDAHQHSHDAHQHSHDAHNHASGQPQSTGRHQSNGAHTNGKRAPWDTAGSASHSGPLGEQLYTCAMHPQVRSPNPDDRCPICGMELIPVPQDEHDHGASPDAVSLTLSARALALTGVRTEPVQRGSAAVIVRVPGRIQVDESRRHTVSARVDGRLEKLYVNTTGARVQAGDHLADIYSPELLAAQEELLQAVRLRARENRGELGYQAARDKLRLLGFSSAILDDIEREGRVRETLPVIAFGPGYVQSMNVVEGQYVQTGQALYELADLGQVWAILEAYETDLPFLAADQAVTLTSASHPDVPLEGQISFIDPWVDELKRTAGVRVVLNNDKNPAALKPGTLVHAQVHAEQPPALLIPASAPLFTGPRSLVYVQEPGEQGRFSAREVVLGPRAGEYFPVVSGLSEGELVVTQGAFRIDSELQIRGRPSMMAPEGGGAPAHDHGGDHGGNPDGHEAGRSDQGDGPVHDHQDQDRRGHNHQAQAENHRAPNGGPSTASPVTTEVNGEAPGIAAGLESVFTAYDQAQQALADDRLDDWRRATRTMQAKAGAVNWPKTLLETGVQLQMGQAEVDQVADLAVAGEWFYHHAQAMITLARQGFAPGTWQVAFCPMASVGEGEGAHWLQRDGVVSNPYFGHAMQRCGDLHESLEGRRHE